MRDHNVFSQKGWLLFGLTLLVLSSVTTAFSASAVAGASATIVYPLAVSTLSNMAFGEIARNDSGGTVTITANGNRIPGNGIDVITASAFTTASFSIFGEPDSHFIVSLPATTTISHGLDSMTVDNFTATTTSGILTAGEQKIAVGATLHLGPNQALGQYSGTFNVTVAYN